MHGFLTIISLKLWSGVGFILQKKKAFLFVSSFLRIHQGSNRFYYVPRTTSIAKRKKKEQLASEGL